MFFNLFLLKFNNIFYYYLCLIFIFNLIIFYNFSSFFFTKKKNLSNNKNIELNLSLILKKIYKIVKNRIIFNYQIEQIKKINYNDEQLKKNILYLNDINKNSLSYKYYKKLIEILKLKNIKDKESQNIIISKLIYIN